MGKKKGKRKKMNFGLGFYTKYFIYLIQKLLEHVDLNVNHKTLKLLGKKT